MAFNIKIKNAVLPPANVLTPQGALHLPVADEHVGARPPTVILDAYKEDSFLHRERAKEEEGNSYHDTLSPPLSLKDLTISSIAS